MATTSTLTLCDDLAAYLKALADPLAPATVKRAYLRELVLSETKGRQVVLFPTGYFNAPATRGEDTYTHNVTALVWHKYPLPTTTEGPPQAWLDDEVDWVHTYVVEGLEFFRDGVRPTFASGQRDVVTISADVTELYDADRLNREKTFYCAVEMVFEELI